VRDTVSDLDDLGPYHPLKAPGFDPNNMGEATRKARELGMLLPDDLTQHGAWPTSSAGTEAGRYDHRGRGFVDPVAEKADWLDNWGSRTRNGMREAHTPSDEELKAGRKVTGAGKLEGPFIATVIMSRWNDYKQEKSSLQHDFLDHGHLLVFSPRYHPEMAGLGIEYCWGKAKWCYRRYINDLQSSNFKSNVVTALGR